mgnify:CR=1 FL=1
MLFRTALLATFVLLLGFSSAAVGSYSETQSDWSGGDGAPGPVTGWSDDFDICSDIVYYETEGQLTLGISFASPIEHNVAGGLAGVSDVWAEDINGDGHIDLINVDEDDGRVFWWKNSGDGSSWTEDVLDTDFDGAVSVCALDVEGDGDMDIAAVSESQSLVKLWLNLDGSGTYWTSIEIEDGFNGGTYIYPADVNGDGYEDLVGAAYNDNDIVWWENVDGSGSDWIKRTIDSSFGTAYSAIAGDIDGDGKIDVVGTDAGYYNGKVAWWRNVNGSGSSWSEHTIDGSFDGAVDACIADIDGDGDNDVVAIAYYSDDIVFFENLDGGGNNWTSHEVESSFDGVVAVRAADIDSDGDMDIAAAAENENEIAWFENINRVGTNWQKRDVTSSFTEASGLYIADIDGNGNSDIAGVAAGTNQLKWWEVVGFAPDGQLVSSILDTEIYAAYDAVTWDFDEPAGTNVYFKLRTSNNPGNMGSWSAPIQTPGGIVDVDIARYVQYQVFMTSTDYSATPILNSVTINYHEIGGVADATSPVGGFGLAAPTPNPTAASATIGFSIPVASRVSLELFDCSGRLVRTLVSSEMPGGMHQEQVSGLQPGLYLCRLRAAGEVDTRSLVVIR